MGHFGRGIEVHMYGFHSGHFFQLTEWKQGPPDSIMESWARSMTKVNWSGGVLKCVHPLNSKRRLSPSSQSMKMDEEKQRTAGLRDLAQVMTDRSGDFW